MNHTSKALMAAGLAACALIAPMTARAESTSYPWAETLWLGPEQGLHDRFTWPLAGVYCHELDPGPRKIQINASWYTGENYGSWVDFWTDGIRTYSGSYSISGACRNPHSVGYQFNAHDNYFI